MLKSDRIRLRAVEPSDAEVMFDIENTPEIWTYSRQQAPLSMSVIARYASQYDADPLRSGQLRLMIEDIDNEDVCGIIDLYNISPIDRHAWVGIVILDEYRHLGYGREAVVMIKEYSSEILRLNVLAAKIAATNIASINLFKSAGFVHCGTLPEWISGSEGAEDMLLFSCRMGKSVI